MIRRAPAAALLLAACACSESPQAAAEAPRATAPRQMAAAFATARATAAAVSGKGQASKVEEETPLYDFDHAYPAEAARIVGLKGWLDQERDGLRRQLIADATQGRDEARESGFEFHPYGLGKSWLKVTETPRFLSLSATLYSYSGGAHPNHGFDSLLWDKAAGARRAPLDLFSSPAAFDRAVRGPFCDALDKQRAERRDAPVERGSGNEFDQCIAASEQTVILGSGNGRTFDRIGVLVAPYAAGPYAEGDYEVTLPVSRALLDAVKPEFRAQFSVR